MSTKFKSKLPTQPTRMVVPLTPLTPEVIVNPVATVLTTETNTSTSEIVEVEVPLPTPVETKKLSYDYKVIVTRNNLDMFQLTVKEHLNSGWELSGGISCTMYADSFSASTIWSQAIYKIVTN